MRRIAVFCVLACLGCNSERPPATQAELESHLRPGRIIETYSPLDRGVYVEVPRGYGLRGADIDWIEPGTRCRVVLDLGGGRERTIKVKPLSGVLADADVEATIARKDVRPID